MLYFISTLGYLLLTRLVYHNFWCFSRRKKCLKNF
nr:MAG TPA: hypothetical protein [Caudoviricetes sp.]